MFNLNMETMKPLKKALLILLAFVTTPLLAQRYTITSNRDLSAPFDTYKTYGWAKHVTTTTSLAYALNDAIMKSKIQDAVAHELKSRNYVMNQRNPDVLINYRVFDKAVNVKDADGYFHDNSYWGTDEVRNNALGSLPFASSYYDQNSEYYFDKGTLMVQLVDAKKGVVVWQGYASGLTDGNAFDRNPDHVAQAIRLIFDKYDLVLNQ